MKVIPLIPNPNQALQILLGNQEITLRVYQRSENLYIDMRKADTVICLGQRCVFGRSLITFAQNIFKGSLHFFDIKSDNSPNYSELSSRFFLIYLEENENMPLAFKW